MKDDLLGTKLELKFIKYKFQATILKYLTFYALFDQIKVLPLIIQILPFNDISIIFIILDTSFDMLVH